MSLDKLIDDAAAAEKTLPPPAPPPRGGRHARFWSIVLAALTVLGVAGFVLERPGGPDQRALEAGRRHAIAIATVAVRDFARSHDGKYPDRLSDAMFHGLGLGYRKLDDGFELIATLPDGKTIAVKER